MSKIAIIYYSATGSTYEVARAVEEGACVACFADLLAENRDRLVALPENILARAGAVPSVG